MLRAKPADTRLGDPEENRKTIYRNVCAKNIRREKTKGREEERGRKLVGVCTPPRIKLAHVSIAHFSFFPQKVCFPIRDSARHPTARNTRDPFPQRRSFYVERVFSFYLNKNTASVPRSKQCNEIA